MPRAPNLPHFVLHNARAVPINTNQEQAMKYEYSTGRHYNGAQILAIDAPALPDDPIADVRVTFRDASRGIDGAVKLMACECYTVAALSAGVLREYDAGRYDQI
jgi:hypothetical protein